MSLEQGARSGTSCRFWVSNSFSLSEHFTGDMLAPHATEERRNLFLLRHDSAPRWLKRDPNHFCHNAADGGKEKVNHSCPSSPPLCLLGTLYSKQLTYLDLSSWGLKKRAVRSCHIDRSERGATDAIHWTTNRELGCPKTLSCQLLVYQKLRI